WDDSSGAEDLVRQWKTPGFDPAEDIRLVFAPDGELAGYIETFMTRKPPVHPEIWGRVDPDYEGLGIGTWMLHWAEKHVKKVLPLLPAGSRFAPRTGVWSAAEKSKKLFDDLGYHYVRSFYIMEIEMDAPVPEPQFPEGISLRTYNPGTDLDAVYRADQDAFRDHFGFVEEPYEEGLERFKHHWLNEEVDPALLFLAMDGEEIAGFNLCRPHSHTDPETGWVGSLGVLRPWRKRGIGLALLRHSFNEFYRRGKRKVGLGVDAQNLTGALRLYQNAGMHIQRAFDNYEKELRPGTEMSVRSLS
ncbi:MAG: GNAT family N-acetyltransferase, partial [Bacteroidota bacterium]